MSQDNVVRVSSFDRVMFNDKKMGEYFTNHNDAMLLGNFFKFPDGEQVCCLDPSCGDGMALKLVTKSFTNDNIVKFGVELDKDNYEEAKPNVKYVIQADFMQEVRITREVFSFCYMNPPYGESLMRERYEKIFFKKVDTYIKKGGFLCYVVPYYIFVDDASLAKIITNRYDILSTMRFNDFTYKQVVLILKKKEANSTNPQMAATFQEYITAIDGVALIPPSVDESNKFLVPASSPDDVKTFEGQFADKELIKTIPAQTSMPMMFRRACEIPSVFKTIGRPPEMPQDSQKFLLVACGYGKGEVGDEAEGDRHLQRGRIIDGTSIRHEEDPITKKVVEFVKTFKKTVITVLENNGKLTKLEATGKS